MSCVRILSNVIKATSNMFILEEYIRICNLDIFLGWVTNICMFCKKNVLHIRTHTTLSVINYLSCLNFKLVWAALKCVILQKFSFFKSSLFLQKPSDYNKYKNTICRSFLWKIMLSCQLSYFSMYNSILF